MRSAWILLASAALVSPVAASDLELSVRSGGVDHITVGPGATVPWSIVGELTDSGTQGLAFFVLDVDFDGGGLAPADTPASSPMTSFATPLGLNNPAGFGGTLSGGDLIQVGGAQNTIQNAFASAPIGSVSLGVALPGSPETLVTGSLVAPVEPGTYTLTVDNVMANGVRAGETGIPFWAVDAVGVGAVSALTVEVEAFSVDVDNVSIGGLGSQVMTLDAGIANAGRQYYILGSVTGVTPGLSLASGAHIPLNPGPYFFLLLDFPNILIASQIGLLDGAGQATATFTVPPGTPTSLIGFTLQHAYVLLNPKDYVSNVVDVTLDP